MCRNITTLRGLEPEATQSEIEAAALQYVRKVAGLQTITSTTAMAVEQAVQRIAAITAELIGELRQDDNHHELSLRYGVYRQRAEHRDAAGERS